MTAPEAIAATEQDRIVFAPLDGPYVVNAGAGTGKTFTLVRRAVRLVHEQVLRPDQILVITFTKKAANEIAERLAGAFQDIGIFDLPTCGTFHGIAAEILREFAYATGESPDLRAIDDPRARGVFRVAYDELLAGKLDVDLSALPILDREDVLVSDLAALAFKLKNQGVTVDAFENEALEQVSVLRNLPYGQLFTAGKRKSQPRLKEEPNPSRTRTELAAEAEREERNVRAIAALFRRFDTLLAEESLLTYGDLLTRAIATLKSFPEIAQDLRTRWRHALVDELQDTNKQQLAFLRAIFGDDLRPVMAVGDVRQAIYAWNGADPAGIIDLAERPGTTTFPLTENRRSFQDMLDTAHSILPDSGAGSGTTPLVARAGAATHRAVRHGVFRNGADVATCREEEANAIASEIAGLIASGERPRDIAILLRSRPAARVYAAALRERGIASRTHGGVGFFDAPEIIDAVAWFRIVCDPSDRAALIRILESPVVGLSDGTIAKLVPKGVEVAEVLSNALPSWLEPVEAQRLDRFRAIVGVVGRSLGAPVVDAVRATLREAAIDAGQIAQYPSGAAQIQANVAKLVSLADGFAQDRPLARLSDFVAEIDARAALEDDESEAEIGGDEVPIMTIHAAKGLEWNHVFVANVSFQTFPNAGRRAGDTVMIDSKKALAFAYGVDGKKPFRWILRQPHVPETGERYAKEPSDISEEQRLLYVAITRAKRCVWISGVHPAKRPASKLLMAILAYADGRPTCHAFPDVSPDVSSALSVESASIEARASMAHAADLTRLQTRLLRQPSLFEPWRGKLSYTAIATFVTCPRLARLRYALRVPDFRDVPEHAIDSIDKDPVDRRKIDAATHGNIIHRALEKIALDRIAGRAPDVEASVDIALDEADQKDDLSERARVMAAVHRSREALRSFTPISAEEQFTTTIAGAEVGGFLDLVARDEHGDVWIIDYKTGRQPDESYAAQLGLYRFALSSKYPNSRLAILRITDQAAGLVEPAIPTNDEIERLVIAAAPMDRDEPKPGIHCLSCAYAGPLCYEGAAAILTMNESS